MPIRAILFDAFFAALFAVYAQAQAWRLLDGVMPALATIRATKRLTGAVSNFDHRLPSILEVFGIEYFFDVVVYPQRCGAAKPDPAIFEAALTALEVAPAEALHIGHDRERDLDAAASAGLANCHRSELGDIAALIARLDWPATLGASS
jgi:putative hydrolase of the HAD superfamily